MPEKQEKKTDEKSETKSETKKDEKRKNTLTKEVRASLIIGMYEGLCRAGFTYESMIVFGKKIFAGMPISSLDGQSIKHLEAAINFMEESGVLDVLRPPPSPKEVEKKIVEATGNGEAKTETARPDEVVPPKKPDKDKEARK